MGKVKEWVYCVQCERAFEVELSEKFNIVSPGEECIKDAGVLAGEFLAKCGTRYPRCPYVGCNGTRLQFHWWSDIRHLRFDYPEVPKLDVVYPNPMPSEKGNS